MWRDFQHCLRLMRKNPVFAATAVFTLALGIGGNTAIFTVVRAVLLKPLEYSDPDRLVQVTGGATPMRFEEMRTGARSYTEIGAFRGGVENVTLSGGELPEVLKQARVSANFLHILGAQPALGRSFLPEEDTPGGAPVAMISTELWQRRFNSDPQISGKTAMLASTAFTIVGVLPKGFKFPFAGVDVWVTKPYDLMPPLSPYLAVFGRLKPQVNLDQASAELAVLNRQYAVAHPGMLDSKPRSIARVVPLKERLVKDVRSMLWMLFGAVGFVLLIACANVASLLLARATSRSREFAVRAAVGASRGRLMAQLLAESLVLAVAGGALGILLAKWALTAITRMTAFDLPRIGEVRLDGTVLGFAIALSLGTGIVFGLFPSLGASRPDLASGLRAGGERTGGASARQGILGLSTRGLLVVVQVALSMVLLIGAALLVESIADMRGVNPGFQPANLLTMGISLAPSRYSTGTKQAAFYDQLVRRVETLPGVRSAAMTWTLPMTGYPMTPVQLANQTPLKLNERQLGMIQFITPAYFRTLEVPLRRGREFTKLDTADAAPVAIVNEALARHFWAAYPGGPDPIGQLLLIGSNTRPVEIVGIVANVHQALEVNPDPAMYRPASQGLMPFAMFAVRTEGDPLRFANAVRGEVLAIDRDQAVSNVKSMDELMEESFGQRHLILTLLGTFAGVALLLAIVGVYGVIAYSVAQRTQEVGIRRALGAQQGDILRLVLGQGLALVLGGIALGAGGAFALTRVMKDLLFQISATDPATFVGVALLFTVVALAAGYIPARRATRIDPMAALR